MFIPNRDDYPRAACKLLADALVLKARHRYDGAVYLAGYVVECSLKALIKLEVGQVKRTHDLAKLHDTVARLVSEADVRTARFAEPLADVLRNAGIIAWDPQMRYCAPTADADQADQWTTEARHVYSVVVGGLVMDGTLGHAGG